MFIGSLTYLEVGARVGSVVPGGRRRRGGLIDLDTLLYFFL